MKYRRALPALYLAVALVPVLMIRFAHADEKTTNTKQNKTSANAPTKYAWPSDPALYVGPETCKGCHEDLYKHFEGTSHFLTTMQGKLETKAGPEWQGCESCHGPGKEHVDAGGDKTKIFTFKDASPKQTSAICLRCHQFTEEHGNYNRSMHLANGVGCADCHSPHHAPESQFLMKAKAPDLCYTCHMNVRAEFARPFRHRVNEGLVQCNDCHSPHGTVRAKQLRTDAAGGEVCYKCHTEKQGPFVYQHEAKVEGCTACHSPHGSTNQRLLKQNQVNLLCISCHSQAATAGPPGTPSFHDQSTKYQSCTLCHTAIHGSNTSSVFFTP
jgi:DmsE family decaheme c-type cytochrome